MPHGAKTRERERLEQWAEENKGTNEGRGEKKGSRVAPVSLEGFSGRTGARRD